MKPECILIRVGEQALKSEQVLIIFNRFLIRNISASLKGIKYELRKEQNRIFIDTKNIDKAIERLQRVFGITSLSPVYISEPTIIEMQKTAKKIFKPGKKKFAIRARRAGSHKFTSQDIAKDVGFIIDGSVDLSNPQKELFIECRQNKAYLFIDKILGPGGLPLGSGGKIYGILNNDEDFVACWLMMKRGCEIIAVSNKKPLISKLKKWHTGLEMQTVSKINNKNDIGAVVIGEKSYESFKNKNDFLMLRPLVALNYRDILTRING